MGSQHPFAAPPPMAVLLLLPAALLLLVGRAAAQACPGSLTPMATITNYSYPGSAMPPLNLLACEVFSPL